MDNHEAHISLAAIAKAKANGVVVLTIPPYTSHKLQPLYKLVYGPYKRAYGRAAVAWMRFHPNTSLNVYHIPGQALEAQLSACVPRNIITGFQSTGIFSFNSKVFCDDDFARSAVSDRDPSLSQMVTSVENSEQSAKTQTIQGVTVSVAVATEKDMPGTSTAINEPNDSESTLNSIDLTASSSKTSHFTNDASRHPGTSYACVTPSDILPFQKAGPRRQRTLNRRKGSTRIMTDTPVRDEIAAASNARAKKRAKPVSFSIKRNLFKEPRELVHNDTSSSESESLDYLNDDSDSVDEDEADQEIIERDFVVVKVHWKSSMRHYIARVDAFDGDEFEAVFLRRVLSLNDFDFGATFVINEDDEALWLRQGIAKKLPNPKFIGTSRRTQFQFPSC